MSSIFVIVVVVSFLFGCSPDGHFKIPHLWPGQNTPPEVRFHPKRESALSLQLLDWKIHIFSFFHPERFRLFAVNLMAASLRR